jgi:hypothetical protein
VAIYTESVERFLQRLPQKSETTLEAISSWGWLADALKDRGHRVHLGHPLKVKVEVGGSFKIPHLNAPSQYPYTQTTLSCMDPLKCRMSRFKD